MHSNVNWKIFRIRYNLYIFFNSLCGNQVSPRNNLQMGLQNLEELSVQTCYSLEVIFNYGDGLSRVAPSLNKLRILYLNDLPELMHIWNYKAAGILLLSSSFQNLRVLTVQYCY